MLQNNVFFWSPVIALLCGATAALGVLRSFRCAYWSVLGAMAFQIIACIVFLMALPGDGAELGDWNSRLVSSYFVSLLVVTPFTVIGAVPVGAILMFFRGRRQRNHSPVSWEQSIVAHLRKTEVRR